MTDAAKSVIDAKTSSPGLMSRDLISKKANLFERSIAGELANKYLTQSLKPDVSSFNVVLSWFFYFIEFFYFQKIAINW